MQDYDRLDAVAQEFFGNINLLAEKINITSQSIYGWKKRGIGFKQLQRLKEVGINPDYIKTGEGPMMLDSSSTNVKYTEVFTGRGNISAVYDIPNMTPLQALIQHLNLEHTTIAQMKELKSTMIDKIKEMNRYIKAGYGK